MKKYKAYKVNGAVIVIAESLKDAELTFRAERDYDVNAVHSVEEMQEEVIVSPDINPNE